MRRAALLYTDNSLPEYIWSACQAQLRRCLEINGIPLLTVSHLPVDLGRNILFRGPRGAESMFRQILDGLENLDADLVYLVEHDVLYHPCHFEITPADDGFWYNRSQWHLDAESGRTVYFEHDDPSQLSARRAVLLDHYRRVVGRIAQEGYHSAWGFSPPKGMPQEQRRGIALHWRAEIPNIDIRHPGCLTRSQWFRSDFRNRAGCRGWKEGQSVPGWGITRGRVAAFLAEVAAGEVPCATA